MVEKGVWKLNRLRFIARLQTLNDDSSVSQPSLKLGSPFWREGVDPEKLTGLRHFRFNPLFRKFHVTIKVVCGSRLQDSTSYGDRGADEREAYKRRQSVHQ